MKKLIVLCIAALFAQNVQANGSSTEKAIQHLKVADVTSLKEAKKIFTQLTTEISSKKSLDIVELQQLHILTYTLEKSVAYFADNLTGDSQKLAQKLAIVVEDIHINSENNRKEKTKDSIDSYLSLATKFSAII